MNVTVHNVYSSAPHITRKKQVHTFKIEVYELLLMVLSLNRWKQWYPEIKRKLYCDDLVYRFLEEKNLLDLYDEIDTSVLTCIPSNINQRYFWAACKVFAYKDAAVGSIFQDTDFILHKKPDLSIPSDLLAAYPDLIPDNFLCDRIEFNGRIIDQMSIRKEYKYPSYTGLLQSETFRGINASFLQFNELKLKNTYTDNAIDFMLDNKVEVFGPFFSSIYICFAEQNLLLDTANHLGNNIRYLSEVENDYKNHDIFYHLAGDKYKLKNNEVLYLEFANSILELIKVECPNYYDKACGLLQFIKTSKPIISSQCQPKQPN